jgi:hypothetical protein
MAEEIISGGAFLPEGRRYKLCPVCGAYFDISKYKKCPKVHE